MTPRSIFMIIILAITMGIGGALGYFIGNHKALNAEKQLDQDITIGKVQDVTHDQLVEQLKTQNQKLQKDFDDYQAASQKSAADSTKQWQATLAAKDQALQVATKNSTSAQVQVNELKAKLFLAVSPQDKEDLQKQLDTAQKQLNDLQARTDGLKCLDTPIPKEYIDAVNSSIRVPAPTP